jgi:hypothetical protein
MFYSDSLKLHKNYARVPGIVHTLTLTSLMYLKKNLANSPQAIKQFGTRYLP